jgi:hypothetical protein
LLGTFDVPDMQTTCTRRIRSNTPLQALTLANDAVFLELAQAFAARLHREAGDLEARLRLGFQLSLGREPSAKELSILQKYTEAQATEYAEDTAAAKAVAGPALTNVPPAEGATLVAAARVLLNTDSFITRE